jgi:hypothetical protein
MVEIQGQKKWEPWKFNYTVGKPSGAVSLPEMNVLYRGYDNKVQGAVSGFVDYKLSGSNVSLSKKGDMYIGKPGSGREATISISGVAEDGTTASVGKFEFRVRDLPKPTIKLGSVWDGEKVGASTIKAMTRLFAQYPPEIPLLAEFRVTAYEVVVSGAPRSAKGTGSALNGDAVGLLKQARAGSTVTIMTDYRGPDGRTLRKNAVIQVN